MTFDIPEHMDESDVRLWANNPASYVFCNAIISLRDVAIGRLRRDGKENHDKNAAMADAYDIVLRLFDEARDLTKEKNKLIT